VRLAEYCSFHSLIRNNFETAYYHIVNAFRVDRYTSPIIRIGPSLAMTDMIKCDHLATVLE